MTNFTKGPWSVEVTKFGNIESAQVFYPHGFLTSANVIPVDETRLEGKSWIDMRDRTESQRRANDQESIANMHLIAAAPEMYEVLSEILDDYSDAVEEWTDESLDYGLLMVDKAKKILAKARGEA